MTKTAHIQHLLHAHPSMTSFDIAALAGCHPAYVRAVKQRVLDPSRHREEQNWRYHNKVKTDPIKYRKWLDDRNQSGRDCLMRLKQDPKAYEAYLEKRRAYYHARKAQ